MNDTAKTGSIETVIDKHILSSGAFTRIVLILENQTGKRRVIITSMYCTHKAENGEIAEVRKLKDIDLLTLVPGDKAIIEQVSTSACEDNYKVERPTEKDAVTKEPVISIGLYFEVKGSEIYGGPEDVGYANITVTRSISEIEEETLTHHVMEQLEGVANMLHVPKEQIRLISKEEFEKTPVIYRYM